MAEKAKTSVLIVNLAFISKRLSAKITKKFEKVIENKWLTENIEVIKRTFEIRTNKYDKFVYYNIYTLLITILKNLFDINLFMKKEIIVIIFI